MQLYPFQEEGVTFLQEHQRGLLADDMGLGKTAQAISAAQHACGANAILVATVDAMKYPWQQELKMWAPQLTSQVIDGPAARRMKQWRTPAEVYIVTHESLLRDYTALMVLMRWDCIIIDECHKVKNRKTKLFKMFQKLCRQSPHLYLLTGTPIQKHPADLWTLFHLMHPKRYSSFWSFVKKYCYVEWNGFNMDIGDIVHAPELAAEVAKHCLRREKATVGIQLPSKIVQQVWLDLDLHQRRVYDAMQKEYFVALDGHELAAVNTISMGTYLRSLTIDPTLVTAPTSNEPLQGAKIRALLDIIEGSEEPLVVFTTSARAANRLAYHLADNYMAGVITGQVPAQERTQLVQAFQDGILRILICTIRAGGLGITLTRASTAVFLDKDWVPSINTQAQDRLHRIGQTSPVHIIELLARGTIDEHVEELHKRRTELTVQTLRDSIR